MPVIWAAISGHGYGHAAQVVPVLNALGRLVPGLTALLRTTVPASFFRDRLTIPWDLQPVQQDVGCVQQGPLKIDVRATWEALVRFHATWDKRVAEEVTAMQSVRPQIILGDTPYLACEAGSRTGIPTVALANFTWDEVLSPFTASEQPPHHTIVERIRQSYGHADLALRIAPGLPLRAFREVRDIGPIADPAASRRKELRTLLGIDEHERLVLIGFGGIPLPSLPWNHVERMDGYRFLFDGTLPRSYANIRPLAGLPFSFKEVLASVDVVMTKPGYGTTVEAVILGLPMVYVRRHNFADEQPLVEFLLQYGRAGELLIDDFLLGRWQSTLDSVHTLPLPQCAPPRPSGAHDAATILAGYL